MQCYLSSVIVRSVTNSLLRVFCYVFTARLSLLLIRSYVFTATYLLSLICDRCYVFIVTSPLPRWSAILPSIRLVPPAGVRDGGSQAGYQRPVHRAEAAWSLCATEIGCRRVAPQMFGSQFARARADSALAEFASNTKQAR